MTALGRLPSADARDRHFLVRRLLAGQGRVSPDQSRVWEIGPILDQKATPRCVGFSWKAWMNGAPVEDRVTMSPAASTIYRNAQAIDGWDLPHDGTSVRAGVRALGSRVLGYHWAFDTDAAIQYLLTTGTLVAGTNWYGEMFETRANGEVRIGGPVAGGHAYHVYGWDGDAGMFLCQNSWGQSWGKGGVFLVEREMMDRLLDEDGELCAARERGTGQRVLRIVT